MHYHNDLCKFHGKFKELVPAGWKFQKLFANNYRQYCLDVTPCESIRVWQHHGGYIEIGDLYGASKQVIEAVLLNNFPWHTFKNQIFGAFGEMPASYGFTIDREIGKMIPQERHHDAMCVYIDAEKAGKSPDEVEELVDSICKKYSRKRICNDMITAIKGMADKGWIKV